MATSGRRLARHLLEGRLSMKKESVGLEWPADALPRAPQGSRLFLSLPRSEGFLAWTKRRTTDKKTLEEAARHAFPHPLEELHWGSIADPSEPDGGVLFASLPK